MKAKYKIQAMWVLVGLLGLLGVGSAVGAFSGVAKYVVESGAVLNVNEATDKNEAVLGGTFSSNPGNLTASDDWQAVNSLFEYGDLEVDGTTYLDGAVNLSSGLTVSSGDSVINNLIGDGTATTLSPTSTQTAMTLTAAQVCDSSVLLIDIHATGTQLTLTLPATTTLLADCIDAAGEYKDVNIIGDSVTSTILAIGSGGTLLLSSSSTIQGADAAILRLIADTASTYKALLINAL